MKQQIKYSFFLYPNFCIFYVEMNYMRDPVRIIYVRFMLMTNHRGYEAKLLKIQVVWDMTALSFAILHGVIFEDPNPYRLILGSSLASIHNLTSRKPCNLLTPWSRVLLEKLTGFAASQEIPRIYGTRKFITVPTSARHLSLS
jgi:hypothetical protein